MAEQRRQPAVQIRQGREGSRWFNARPTAEEFVEWFKSVPIHEGLKHETYVGGVVLIQQNHKEKEVSGFNQQTGAPIIVERQSLLYTPHPTVGTRIQYFEDWKKLDDQKEVTALLQVDPPPLGADDLGLPEGFFRYAANGADGKPVTYIGYSVRLRIYERGSVGYHDVKQGPTKEGLYLRRVAEGKLLAEFASGTKIVAASGRYGPDENALMKTQTGAVGRALGMAGMLVIPGSAVATAEDMQEIGTPAVGPGEDAAPPTTVDPKETLRELLNKLKEDPTKEQHFREWVEERGIRFESAPPGEIQMAIKRAEKILG